MTDVARGDGSVYQRKDGRWAATVTIRPGKRVTRYAEDPDAAEAQRLELVRLREWGAATKKLKLADFLRAWLADVRGTVRWSTHRHYANIVDNHLVPELGKVAVSALTPTMVGAYLRDMEAQRLSPRTVRHHRAVLRNALNAAMTQGLVTRNAAALAKPPKLSRRPDVQSLTVDQARTLIDGTTGDRLHALYVMALMTGLRQGELLGLSWDDVDWKRRRIRVAQTLQRQDGAWVFAEPKTDRSTRWVPLVTEAYDALLAHRERMASERTPDWRYFGLVFVTEAGNPIHGPNLLADFYDHLDRLELPRIPWHGLRHSTASVLLAAGVPMALVSWLLGHATVRLTVDTYSHLEDAMVDTVREAMETAYRKPPAVNGAVSSGDV